MTTSNKIHDNDLAAKKAFQHRKNKLKLKHIGHQLLYEIILKGYKEYDIYQMLANKLNVPYNFAHFSMMNYSLLVKAIEIMHHLRKTLPVKSKSFKVSKVNTIRHTIKVHKTHKNKLSQ